MPVVCDQCGTENRENAKFCKGCAARLPAFVATGPSAIESMKTLRTAHAPAAAAVMPPPGQLPIETRAFWVRFAVLSVLVTTVFVSWYAYVTRKVPSNPALRPASVVAAAAPAAAVPATAAKAPLAPLDVPKNAIPEPVRATETLAPGERLVESGTAQPVPPQQVAMLPPRNDAQSERLEHPRKVAARPSGSDPRPGCAHLNFIAASRCEANQCAKPQYYKHPHCSAVREQTRRDVARRNPLQLGY
ncbi:zinc ribbon domain-containing protein [Variovorax sp. JS1663]|uniref:zinc ribbon domain-containing protein n=1 Tax=Variovorax sp. JS1663 TaxID=1851577 RepID=UPI000B349EA1|nr:zinc ribbon domain-containing protein [Variovorax sp. JS1663]OUL98467.1 hypothetical protein A8M77_31455 [Variovorax sp. JS1663]